MKDTICLITGGNSGIGKHTAIQLAAKGAEIIITARNDKKGESAVKEIKEKSQSSTVNFMKADFASFDQVRQLAMRFKEKYDRLDVLINNAGIFVTDFSKTGDGHEMQWQVNYLSPFLLTHLLLDHLEKEDQSKIINVSSNGHYKGRIHFSDPYLEKNYNGLKAYRQSKLANVMFTRELAGRLDKRAVTVNALHPGLIKTRIGHKNTNSWMGWAWWLYKPFMKSEKEGAKTPVKLASDPALSDVTGKYFDSDGSPAVPNPEVNDKSKRERLWEMSREMTGLDSPDHLS